MSARSQFWLHTFTAWVLCSRAAAESTADINSPEFLEASLKHQFEALGEDLEQRRIDGAALGHAEQFRNGEGAPLPVAGRDGRVVFPLGSSLPIVICTPLRVCDIELQQGERVNNVHAGDTGRWSLEPAMSGATVHIVVKPLVGNISTNLAVYTDRRVYHMELQASDDVKKHTPFVSFSYPEDGKRNWFALHAQQPAKPGEASGKKSDASDPQISVDLSAMRFNYEIEKAGRLLVRRRINWMPTRVCDDGMRTIIELPREILARELPILLVRDGDGKDKIRNFTVKGNYFVVDGLFDSAVLVRGVGMQQERVSIRRKED